MRKDISKKLLMQHPRTMSNFDFDFDFQNFDFQKMGGWIVDSNVIKSKSVLYPNSTNFGYALLKMMNQKEIIFKNVFDVRSIDFDILNVLKSGDKIINNLSKENKSVKFNMVYCNVGEFMMGGDSPKQTKIDQSFLLGETEVTQELFQLVMGYNPSDFKTKHKKNLNAQHPVEKIKWYTAIVFCNKLSEIYGLKPYYNVDVLKRNTSGLKEIVDAKVEILGGNGYRLPLEKEWEYAAKAGTNNRYAGTNDQGKIGEFAWVGAYDDSGSTHPVATKKPNEWGFYDMSGNVFEWCWDTINPNKPKLKSRVIRGCCWSTSYYNWNNSRIAYAVQAGFNNIRVDNIPSGDIGNHIGFRICRTI